MDRQSIISEIDTFDVSQQQEAKRLLLLIRNFELDALEKTLRQVSNEVDAYRQLGEEAGVGALGTDTVRAGKEAFMRVRSQVREAVCQSSAVYEICRRPSLQGSAVAAAIILGTLTEANLSGINLPLVAVLLLRAGVDEFCAKVWADRANKNM